ncbi:MAG: DUF4091 domain-containing protein, partial [Lentisphaeria bacterium]|nr:DUF4091 domain-containing protein [Lentisphaeria bacterium]
LTGVNLPGYCSSRIMKGEKIRLTVYFVLFANSDPVEAVKKAGNLVFAGDTSKSVFTGKSRPVVTTGSTLIETPESVIWRMAPELLPAEAPLPAKKAAAWEIAGAANEFIAEQLVITPKKDLKNLQVKISDFTNGKKSIPAKNFTVESVVPVMIHLPRNSVSVNGEYADRLLPVMPEVLPAKRHQGLLISGRIPKNIPAGNYRATVRLSADQWQLELPLTLKVYNFALPEKPAYYSDFLVSGSYADKFTKDKAAARLFCRKDLVKLRLQPAIGLNVFYNKNGDPTCDHAYLVRKQFANHGIVDQRFRIYGTFYCSKFGKLKPFTPEMDAAMTTFAKAAQKAFEKSNMAGSVLWQIGDECHLPEKLKIQVYYSKLTGKVAPKLRRFATINGFNPRIAELVRHSDIIAPHTDIYFSQIRGKMDLTGKEVWIYDNGFMTSGVRLSKVRAVAWKSIKYGISGYHQWSVNAWVKNWKPGDDYSGCIYYPPEKELTSPQRSMRLVNYALTVSDYDYMTILNSEIKRTAGSAESAAAAKELTGIIDTVSPDCWNQTFDYANICEGRAKIAGLIEKLQKVKAK